MSGFDVVAFTRDYEAWLGSRILLVAKDLRDKHTAMTDSTFRFLRGTYYLWLRRVAGLVPDLLHHPAVPLIGDVHVENFGTWLDRDGTRRWGGTTSTSSTSAATAWTWPAWRPRPSWRQVSPSTSYRCAACSCPTGSRRRPGWPSPSTPTKHATCGP